MESVSIEIRSTANDALIGGGGGSRTITAGFSKGRVQTFSRYKIEYTRNII